MLEQIQKIIVEAGNLAYSLQENFTKETKKDGSLVTSADIAVSSFLEKELSKFYPVLSEENYSPDLVSLPKVFVVDPIDGTISYSKKQDSWAILVALVENGITTMSFIYQPSKKKMFYAQKGHGSFLQDENGNVFKLKTNNKLNKLVLSPNSKKEIESKKLIEKITNIEETTYQFGAGLKMMKIAQGESDMYVSLDKKCGVWDILAPKLVLEEAGGFLHFEPNYSMDLKKPHVNSCFVATGKATKNPLE